MRLDSKIKDFLKQAFGEGFPDVRLFLFGSRVNDDALGGDIDVMILSANKIDKRYLRTIRIEFYKKFGWQKIDLVNFTYDDNSVFKQLIQTNAIEL